MKWIKFMCTLSLILFTCPTTTCKQLNITFGFDALIKTYCQGVTSNAPIEHIGNLTVFDFCMDLGQSFDLNEKSKNIFNLHKQVASNYSKFIGVIDILESRVSLSELLNLTIDSKQSFHYLEIANSSHGLLLADKENGNVPIDDKINLDSSISGNWTNYRTLDKILNETEKLKGHFETIDPIVENEIVWINQSVTINGSCCMIANISLEPGQQITTTNLTIDKDDKGNVLDGEFTWGFMSRNHDVDKNVSDVVTFKTKVDASEATFFSPSINLTDAVHSDETTGSSFTVNGNVSFNHLELESVEIHEEEDKPITYYSLLDTIKLNNTEPIDLCYLNMSRVEIISLYQPVIGNVNLANLLTRYTNQLFDKTIKLKEIQLNGSRLSDEHQFANKLATKLSSIVKSATYLHYNTLTLNKINVTDLTTNTWDDWMLNNATELLNFNDMIINRSVDFLDHVNDLRWDYDLVRVDGEEKIDCKLIFDDQLIISDDLASKRFGQNLTMDDWLIKGDLIIDGLLNNKNWNILRDDLVNANNPIDHLDFGDSVEVADCYFGTINDVDTLDLMKTNNISRLLTFNNLRINNLTLDQVNVSSCLLNDQIVSDEINPIDQLNIAKLVSEGTINEIKPSQLLVNCSDQDFTKFNGSLMASSVSFKNLTTLSENSDCSTPKLNEITLDRLLRADPELKWPETVILKSSNITNLTNLLLINSLSNVMNNSDQTINANFKFLKNVEFTNQILIQNNESSINFHFAIEKDQYLDKLNVEGNLTVNHLYDLSEMANISLRQGISMTKNLMINDKMSSPDGVIYANSEWKVHRPSTITTISDLIVNNLTIEKDLMITNDHILPWLRNDSLDGIGYYDEVILVNLTTDFNGNVAFNQLESNSTIISLEDITNSSFGYLQPNLHFDSGVTINDNFTSNSDVNMNFVKIYV